MTKLMCVIFFSIVFNTFSFHSASQSIHSLRRKAYTRVDIKTLLDNPSDYADKLIETEGRLQCSAFHCGLFTYNDSTICDNSTTGHTTVYRNFYSMLLKYHSKSKASYFKLEALSDTTVVIRGIVDTTVTNPPWENCLATLKQAFIVKLKP